MQKIGIKRDCLALGCAFVKKLRLQSFVCGRTLINSQLLSKMSIAPVFVNFHTVSSSASKSALFLVGE
jgi:hypothetical protein